MVRKRWGPHPTELWSTPASSHCDPRSLWGGRLPRAAWLGQSFAAQVAGPWQTIKLGATNRSVIEDGGAYLCFMTGIQILANGNLNVTYFHRWAAVASLACLGFCPGSVQSHPTLPAHPTFQLLKAWSLVGP